MFQNCDIAGCEIQTGDMGTPLRGPHLRNRALRQSSKICPFVYIGYSRLRYSPGRIRFFFFISLRPSTSVLCRLYCEATFLLRSHKQLSNKLAMNANKWMDPLLEFLICCSFSKPFCRHRKDSDLPKKTGYILWVVALLEACDVTNNGRHLRWNQVRTARNGNFLCLTWKLRHK